MKVSIEFESAERFFKELPVFAAAVGVAREVTSFADLSEPDPVARIGKAMDWAAALGAVGKVTLPADPKAAPPDPKTAPADPGSAPEPPTEAAESTAEAPESSPAGKSTPETEKPRPDDDSGLDGGTPAPAPAAAADVRAAMNKLIKSGQREAVSALLKEYGAKNFSGLKETDYAAVIEKARALMKGGEVDG